MKELIKKLLPDFIINFYHYSKSQLASYYYNYPTNEMFIIGVTGSKGKTTTANLIWLCLKEAGYKAGLIGTANLIINEEQQLNNYHMTMPGPFILQKHLKEMLEANCQFAIIETPSEGQSQYRHIGINYDVLLFTNITNEKVAAHKYSTEILNKHNSRVFKKLYKNKRKKLKGLEVKKTIVVNNDDPKAKHYLNFSADKKITFGVKNQAQWQGKIESKNNGLNILINNEEEYFLNLPGKINGYNALASIATVKALGINNEIIKKALAKEIAIPGRMELIKNNKNLNIIVDYAHEQVGLMALLRWAKEENIQGKIITIIGSDGGGRDIEKRPELGEISGELSDITIISNSDPYDDPPLEIIEDIAEGLKKLNKKENKDYFLIEDRRSAINKALSIASAEDLILITSKGADQSIIINSKKIPWDDRVVVREELEKI